MIDLVLKGSQTAKDGFANERDIVEKFNSWTSDEEAQKWLLIMRYNLELVDWVKAVVISKCKADINVQIQVKLKEALDVENIQVKLVSNKSGFNQVDKRWLKNYEQMWSIPSNVCKLLQYFTGEMASYKDDTRDSRRMFLDEMSQSEQRAILSW